MAEITCPLVSPRRDYQCGYYSTYSEAYLAEQGTYSGGADLPIDTVQQYLKSPSRYQIGRGLVAVNLSSLSTPIYITEAELVCPDSMRFNFREPGTPVGETHSFIMVDGAGVRTNNYGYGDLRSKNAPLAWYDIPAGTGYTYGAVEVPFVNPGIRWLQEHVGQSAAPLGCRMLYDIAAIAPGIPPNTRESYGFRFYGDGDDKAYLHLIYTAETPPVLTEGYIWVEGTYLAYLDFFRQKRRQQGTTTGQTGTVGGEPWVEGNYLHYIDSSGNERRILGVLTGLTGKVAGQISVNLARGGRKLCYIDTSGNERAFEGTAA